LASAVVANATSTAIHSRHSTKTCVHFAVIEMTVLVAWRVIRPNSDLLTPCSLNKRFGLRRGVFTFRAVVRPFNCLAFRLRGDVFGRVTFIRNLFRCRGVYVRVSPTFGSSSRKLLDLEVFNSILILLFGTPVVERVVVRWTLNQCAIYSAVSAVGICIRIGD